MRSPSPAAASPLTWALTLVLVALIDAAVTRTWLLWGKSDTWMPDLKRLYVWQTYDVAKEIYYPRRDAAVCVALLGNSRIWFAARDAYVERELRRLAPERDIRIDDLAIMGARIGDHEIISRHLDRLRPNLVVIALHGADLVTTTMGQLVNPTGKLFDVGWADGPIPPASMGERVDRWTRTAWPLYRFRRFARERLLDALTRPGGDTMFPEHFESTRAYFEFAHGAVPGGNREAAYQEWRRVPTLEGYVDYLGEGGRSVGYGESVPDPSTLSVDDLGYVTFDRLLARLRASGIQTVVLLVPEDPLLDADTQGKYHRIGFSERSAELIRSVAARHDVAVVDARRWMPPEAFFDFNHMFPDVSGFQTPLAREILHALDS